MAPLGSYCQGCENTFSVFTRAGTNGLAVLDQASVSGKQGVYAEIVINQWMRPGSLNAARAAFGFDLTQRDSPLVAGGISGDGRVLASAEYFNVSSQSWVPTANNLTVPVAYNLVRPLLICCHWHPIPASECHCKTLPAAKQHAFGSQTPTFAQCGKLM